MLKTAPGDAPPVCPRGAVAKYGCTSLTSERNCWLLTTKNHEAVVAAMTVVERDAVNVRCESELHSI